MATFHAMKDEAGKDVIRMLRQGRAGPAARPGQGRRSTARRHDRAGRRECKDPYLAENERLGSQGLRVMATAERDFDPATFDANAADLLPLVSDLTLLALVGIVDPPRAGGQGRDRDRPRGRASRCA